jgi:peptide/nickel transport system ATP-binding protein
MITHDLGDVAEFVDDILVMYGGKPVEYGSVGDVFYEPQHPYTWGLLSSVTRLDRVRQARLKPIAGSPPSLINVPPGCGFHPRCPYASLNDGRCETEVPEMLQTRGEHHQLRCHLETGQRTSLFLEQVKPTL